MKTAYYPPTAEDFKKVRLMSCLTQENASQMLHVTLKTIKNWEKGQVAVPYASFKLLKILSHYELLFDGWEGWSLSNGKLFAPSGRSFRPYELLYVGNMFQMARFWLADREKARELSNVQRPISRQHLKLIIGGLS